MQISVSLKPSFAQLGKAINNVNVRTFLRDEINKLAYLIEKYGKQLVPVDTGILKGSIHVSPATSFLQARVATRTFYDIFVHEGTRYMRARPFMEQGTGFAKKQYEDKDVGARLEKEFVEAFKSL